MRAPDGTEFDIHGPLEAPVVVLVHGLGLTRAVWDQMMPALIPAFRVLRYDLLGHGQTQNPGPPQPTLADLSAQLEALLAYCRVSRVAVVGFSLGGMVARHFAQTHPGHITALAILNSPHQRTDAAQAAIQVRVAQARTQGPAATVEAALGRWFSDPYRAANPDVMDRVRAWVLGNDPAIYPGYYRIFADEVAAVVSPRPALTCPTLVATGGDDYGNGPEMAHAIAADIAGAETLILPGLRHMALMENPVALNAPLREFLDCALRGAP